MVPAGADEPDTSGLGGGVGLDAVEHGGEGGNAVEVDSELLLAGGGDVRVGVVEAGHDEGTGEIDDLRVGALELEDVLVRADGDDGGIGDGEGGDAGRDS